VSFHDYSAEKIANYQGFVGHFCLHMELQTTKMCHKYDRQAEGENAFSDAGTGVFTGKCGEVLYIKLHKEQILKFWSKF
jgi:hypothetical protein